MLCFLISYAHDYDLKSFFTLQVRKEGVTAMFKGFVPVMLRAFPANAVSLLFTLHAPDSRAGQYSTMVYLQISIHLLHFKFCTQRGNNVTRTISEAKILAYTY